MSAKRNAHGCVPRDGMCVFHGLSLVNPKGCSQGHPQGGYRAASEKSISLDVELDVDLKADLVAAGMSWAVANKLEKRGVDGRFYRLQLIFNRRGTIERAQIKPFTAEYRKRVGG